jgi:hypothetical protein
VLSKPRFTVANELVRALKGVAIEGREIITRLFKWRIEPNMRHAF